MKRIIPVLFLSIVLFAACSGRNEQSKENLTQTPIATVSIQPSPSATGIPAAKLSDYFVFTKDVYKKYKGTGNEFAAFETYVDYTKENVIQIRQISGTTSANVYQLKEGALRKVYSREENYFRYDYTTASNQDEILIKEPVREGTSWKLADGSQRSITAVDKKIITPAGEYTTLEITTKRQGATTREYYAKNVGHVKSEFISDNDFFTVTSELEKMETGKPYKHTARFYYPDFSRDRIVYQERDIDINSNEDMKYKFQKELKVIPENSELGKVLSSNTQIRSIQLDENKKIVTVDFSNHLVKEMNAGTSLEMMLLKCITNTLGRYYQVDKVIITLEGTPYGSGHIILEPGEYFTVDERNTAEYKKP